MKISTVRKTAKGALGITVVTGLVLWSYTKEAASSRKVDDVPSMARVVKVAKVSRLPEGATVRLSAITRFATHSRVSFAIGGRIERRPVDVGDRVKKGDIIARIDAAALRNAADAGAAAFSEVSVRLDQAVRDSARMQTLAREGAVPTATEEKIYAAEKALEAAKSAAEVQLNEAKRQLKESTLRAPFDGVVTKVLAEPGEMVEAGTPIVVLDGGDAVEVEIEVPESLVAPITEGQPVAVDLPMIGKTDLNGRVTAVGKSALGPGGLFPVVVTLPPMDGLKSGLTAEVSLPTGATSGLGVPVSAVINPSGRAAALLKVTDGEVTRVSVETHRMVAGQIEVTGPIAAGDIVVTAGHQQLLGGEKVEVLQ